MQERIRALEDFAQIATALAVEMEASQRRIEQRQRELEADLQAVEQSQRRRDELMQQMLQSIAVIQAEIVRIDETHSP